MNNAQLTALRTLAHQIEDAKSSEIVTVLRTDAGFEVRKGGTLVGVTATWEGANELARVAK